MAIQQPKPVRAYRVPHSRLQDRVVAVRNAHPDWAKDMDGIVRKMTEELGEVARAVGGIQEGRDERGDAVHETAQLVVTCFALIGHCFPGVKLLDEVDDEIYRLEHALEVAKHAP